MCFSDDEVWDELVWCTYCLIKELWFGFMTYIGFVQAIYVYLEAYWEGEIFRWVDQLAFTTVYRLFAGICWFTGIGW